VVVDDFDQRRSRVHRVVCRDNGRTAELMARNKPHPPCAFMRPSRAHPYSRDSPTLPSPKKDFEEDTVTIFPAVAVSIVGPKKRKRPGPLASSASSGHCHPPRLWKEKGRARNRNSRSLRRGKRNPRICGRWGFFQAGYQLR
jgi:hypothetical protein